MAAAPATGPSYGAVQVLASAATLIINAEAPELTVRKGVTVQNLGPNDVFVGWDNAVATTTGVRVPANGGTFTYDQETRQALYGRAATADQASPLDTRYIVEAGTGE